MGQRPNMILKWFLTRVRRSTYIKAKKTNYKVGNYLYNLQNQDWFVSKIIIDNKNLKQQYK